MSVLAPRRARLTAVLGCIVIGALGAISATQTWLDVTLATGAEPLTVAGSVALPVLTPLALAALALGLALSIAGRVLSYVFGVLGVAIGAILAVLSLRIAIAVPAESLTSAVAAATGLSGDDAVARYVASTSTTPWPWITAAASLALVALGVLVLASSHRWPRAGRKYTVDAATEPGGSRPHDAVDSWDDLSRGADPTS